MTEPAFLTISADAASVTSLIITVLVWFQTREIRRSIVRNARVPDALKDLQKYSEELRLALKEWPELERDIIGILAKASSLLANVLPKLDGTERETVQHAQSLIKRRTAWWGGWTEKTSQIRHNACWEIYYSLVAATEALRQLHQDYKKRV